MDVNSEMESESSDIKENLDGVRVIQSFNLQDAMSARLARSMNHFIERLGLQNIRAIQERAENLHKHPDHHEKYDIVVSRATAYMTDILYYSAPFLTKDGRIILYKMPGEDERRDIGQACKKYKLRLIGELPYVLV